MATINNSTSEEASSVDANDEILSLLMGDDDEDENTGTSEDDSEGVEKLPNEPTEKDEGSKESGDEEDKSGDEDDNVTWSTLLGVDEDKLVLDDKGNLKGFLAKVDGVTEEVDMKTLVTSYQTAKYNTQRSQAIVEKEKQFTEVINTVSTDYVSKLETAEKLTETLHSNFLAEYEAIDWKRLRDEQPGEFAALVQEYKAKQSYLQNAHAAIQAEKAEELTKQQQREKANLDEFTRKNYEVMLKNNPEWADKTKLTEAFASMEKFVVETYGFSPADFNEVRDARLFEMCKDAMKYRNVLKETKVPAVPKNLPKFIKSSSLLNTKASSLDKKIAAVKKSTGARKRSAEIDAVAELLLGG